MARTLAALATGIVAFLGLLNWQVVTLATSIVALVMAMVAIVRSGHRDDEVIAWKEDQLVRAQQQGTALADELRED